MTEAEIHTIEQLIVTPLQRVIVALAAVHAARSAGSRHLTLDDVDLHNRRIVLAGHDQRLGELPYLALRAWLRIRRVTWPNTPNRHVLLSKRTALELGPVSGIFVRSHTTRLGIDLERIRGDRMLHEALTIGPDPLHLALVFNLSHTTASRYAAIAQAIMDTQIEETP